MSRNLVNILRLAAQYWIPALGTLIFTLGSIWDWSFTENLVGSIMAFDTFLGVLLGFQAKKTGPGPGGYDGELVINTEDASRDVYSLNISTPLSEIPAQKSVVLKVIPPAPQPKEPQE